MKKWEYLVVDASCESPTDYVDQLNLYGDEGWELAVEELGVSDDQFIWTFKRQRSCLDDPAEVFSNN